MAIASAVVPPPNACDKTGPMKDVSVIIPTLNAAEALPACLEALSDGRRTNLVREVVVADGGSRDGTTDAARKADARVVEASPGRGRQLAAGARAATGGWLLFVHADTRLGPGWDGAVAEFIAEPANRERAGVFALAFDTDAPQARRVAAAANWRTRRLGLPYGDQGMLLARAFYESLGGYEDMPLMEDVALVRRIGRRRLRVLNAVAVTSAERYRRGGWWARPARNLGVLSLYFLGMPPAWLKRLYG